jgi:hypothetical protein
VLLVFGAPCQRNLREGQEHGRTIPLSVSAALSEVRLLSEVNRLLLLRCGNTCN